MNVISENREEENLFPRHGSDFDNIIKDVHVGIGISDGGDPGGKA